jgi:CheY-like chemotaxis protein
MKTKPLNLLVVEDDAVDLMAMQRALQELRVLNPVTVAHDGIEALEFLRGENGREKLPQPRLVLLDLKMPRMDGHEFLAAVRADPELHDTVVFVLTTSDHDRDMAEAYRQNVAGYILKSSIGADFMKLITLIDAYWQLVELRA